MHRPKAYNNIDGVGELGIGFMCLAYALLGWLQIRSPKGSVWHGMPAFIIYVGVMLAIIHYGTKAIKKHITYPRTGFVEYRKRDTLWRPMIIAFVVSVPTSAGFAIALRKHWDMTSPVSLIGLFFAATYAYGIAGTVRWKWLVVWLMALGSVVIAMLPADLAGAMANHSPVIDPFPARWVGAFWLTMALYGTLTFISGGISFWLYLRHTQASEQQPQ